MTDEEARERVAHNLKRLRGERSYHEIARECQTSAGAIRNIELGNRMPGIGLMTRLAESLDVPIDELLKPLVVQRSARRTSLK